MHLTFGWEFNQPINEWPKNLTHLIFDNNAYDSDDYLFPHKLCNSFIKNINPHKIKRIYCSASIHSLIHAVAIEKSLKSLIFKLKSSL